MTTSFEDMVHEAIEAMQARRWGAAAALYARAAMWATDRGQLDATRELWSLAGEAWRRDDHPQLAARALRTALQLPQKDPDSTALNRLRLAAVLSAGGNGQGALELCRLALAEAEEGTALQAMALDSCVGTLLGFGSKEEARPLVVRLGEPLAAAFRRGELARLDGRFQDATTEFHAVLEAVADRKDAEGAQAAAQGELAETALQQGEPREAAERFEAAGKLHEQAGRRALALRCEAGRVRAVVESGAFAMPSRIEDGIRFAEERGMVMLCAELRLVRGMALAERDGAKASDDLGYVVQLADRVGARLLAGRARLQAAMRLNLPEDRRRRLLEEAVRALADSVPQRARAEALLQTR